MTFVIHCLSVSHKHTDSKWNDEEQRDVLRAPKHEALFRSPLLPSPFRGHFPGPLIHDNAANGPIETSVPPISWNVDVDGSSGSSTMESSEYSHTQFTALTPPDPTPVHSDESEHDDSSADSKSSTIIVIAIACSVVSILFVLILYHRRRASKLKSTLRRKELALKMAKMQKKQSFSRSTSFESRLKSVQEEGEEPEWISNDSDLEAAPATSVAAVIMNHSGSWQQWIQHDSPNTDVVVQIKEITNCS